MTEGEPRQQKFVESKPVTPTGMTAVPELPKDVEAATVSSLIEQLYLPDLEHPDGDNITLSKVKLLPDDQQRVRVVPPRIDLEAVAKAEYPQSHRHRVKPITDDGDSHYDESIPKNPYMDSHEDSGGF